MRGATMALLRFGMGGPLELRRVAISVTAALHELSFLDRAGLQRLGSLAAAR